MVQLLAIVHTLKVVPAGCAQHPVSHSALVRQIFRHSDGVSALQGEVRQMQSDPRQQSPPLLHEARGAPHVPAQKPRGAHPIFAPWVTQQPDAQSPSDAHVATQYLPSGMSSVKSKQLPEQQEPGAPSHDLLLSVQPPPVPVPPPPATL